MKALIDGMTHVDIKRRRCSQSEGVEVSPSEVGAREQPNPDFVWLLGFVRFGKRSEPADLRACFFAGVTLVGYGEEEVVIHEWSDAGHIDLHGPITGSVCLHCVGGHKLLVAEVIFFG